MNEPANMCRFPCKYPSREAEKMKLPPDPPPLRKPPRDLPGFSSDLVFATNTANFHQPSALTEARTDHEDIMGSLEFNYTRNYDADTYHNKDDLLHPPYFVHNGGPSGELSDLTVRTDIQHANGLWEYDIHNLYGTST
jgi:alpha-glucosidase